MAYLHVVSRAHDDVISYYVIMHSWLFRQFTTGIITTSNQYSTKSKIVGKYLSLQHKYCPAKHTLYRKYHTTVALLLDIAQCKWSSVSLLQVCDDEELTTDSTLRLNTGYKKYSHLCSQCHVCITCSPV